MKEAANHGGRCNLFSPKRQFIRQETVVRKDRDLLLVISKIQNVGRSKSRGDDSIYNGPSPKFLRF
jgi:hypothetical protein